MITLYTHGNDKSLMYNDLSKGAMIQANQHFIIKNGEGMLLDPGGHKIHTRLFTEISTIMPISGLKMIFMSHQDPDIVAAANAWLMMTDARMYLPVIWTRFVAHFGVDDVGSKRITEIPDEGISITLGGAELKIIPAHYLHSSGNFHLYDPLSKILYTGDLGASPAAPYEIVEDFDAHIQYMEAFHKRYMPSSKAIAMWVNMVKALDIEILAPQHGAIFKSKDMANRFIDWVGGLTVGADAMQAFNIPA